MADSAIEKLNLSPTAKKAAYELKELFPEIVFTSGKRDLAGQANAMAGNVAKNRKWIGQTYRTSKASIACQKWVDDNPGKSKSDIAKGLLQTLKDLGASAGEISKHLTGDAFDIQPTGTNANAIKAAAKKLSKKFLDHEGGLCRWHAQF